MRGALTWVLLACSTACSGSSDDGLFSPSGAAGGDAIAAAGAGMGGSAQSGAGGATVGGTEGLPAGGGGDAGGGTFAIAGSAGTSTSGGMAGGSAAAGSGGLGGGGGRSAMAGAGGSGGASAGGGGAGGAPTVGTVTCGADSCSVAGGELCCDSESAGLGCIASGEACSCTGILCSTMTIPCDGTEDCPSGQICCLDDGIGNPKVSCVASCDDALTTDRDELCHPGGDPCTTAGEVCGADDRLNGGFSSCNAP